MDVNNVGRLNVLDWISLILVIVGALNWAAVGLFNYNLVSALFGVMSSITRTIYVLVGLAGLYLAFVSPVFCRRKL
ncbi:DUF378 domain-containing protein [Candidatus Microgenomates bacterium]|nr:MAG: DUF378 domain-containing protein [Candidatus Microgenomates bacterium]